MLELMLRMLVIGALATVAAMLFERGLALLRLPTRFAWTCALLATPLLTVLPRLMPSPVPDLVPQISASALVITAASSTASRIPENFLLFAWLLVGAVVLGIYCTALVRLARTRREWQRRRIADHDVFVSQHFGPAVFGFVRPRIVVPGWVSSAPRDEQKLILLHEREHIRARDHWQLLLIGLATLATPWNPFTWLQARRLRFTIETDCDQRVLATAPDARRYASLLVDVGMKQTGLLWTPALAEHRNGLERRVRMLANKLIRNRRKAAGLIAGGVVLMMVACESRLPNEAPEAQASSAVVQAAAGSEMKVRTLQPTPVPENHERLPMRSVNPDDGPQYVPFTRKPQLRNRDAVIAALQKNYPPLLRNAGIGGTSGVAVLVGTDGRVQKSQIKHSSGRAELDAAALRVASSFEFVPAEYENKPIAVWLDVPVVFRTQ